MSAAESVCPVGAALGEGPAWIDGALWFVDIKSHRIYRLVPDTGACDHWDAPDQVGWVMPAADGGMVAGLKSGIHRFDPATGGFTLLAAVDPDHPDNRLNDATVAPDGTLWFGTMDDHEGDKTGRFYRYEHDRVIDSGLPPVAITNGPAVSPDGGTLYATDTLGGVIWAVPINDDHSLGSPRPFVTIEAGAGHPDGPTVDSEACVWTGLYGGWGLRRYDPAGKLMATVALPVANVTKLAFGGADLRTGYVTTARQGLDAAALAKQPLAGNVFAFAADVAGVGLPAMR